jgi:hypothetical protein
MNRRQLMKTAAGAALLALSDGKEARGVVTGEALPSKVRGAVASALNLAFAHSTHAERTHWHAQNRAMVETKKIDDARLGCVVADIIERGWYKFVTQQETQDKIRDYFGYRCRFCGTELPPVDPADAKSGWSYEMVACPNCGMPSLVPPTRPDRAGTALADILGFYLDPDAIDRQCICVERELPRVHYCPECKTGQVDFNLLDCTCRGCNRRWNDVGLLDETKPGSKCWYAGLDKGPSLAAALVLPVAPSIRHWFWAVKIVDGAAQWPGMALVDTSDGIEEGMPV